MKARSAGFTLIELMFTVAVLALLLALGVPNFRDFLRNSRQTAAANGLLADINVARTEAIKRRVVVAVCATTNPGATTPACAAPTATSFRGWLLFVDDADPSASSSNDGNGVIDTGELLLRRHDLLPSGTTARSDTGIVSFAETGFTRVTASTASATRVVICDSRGNAAGSGGLSAARGVTVAPAGRAAVTRSVATISGLGGC